MKRIVLYLSVLCIISIFACQKEFTIEEDPTIPGVEDSVVLLKKYIRLDTTLAAPNDTIFTAVYSYDNLNRCTLIQYKYFDHDYAPEFEGTGTEKRYYNGTDTNMLYRTIETFNAVDPGITSEYFTYNTAGIVVKDSVVEDALTWATFSYRFDGNWVHSVAKFATVPGDTTFYSKKLQQKTNGNIVLERDSLVSMEFTPPEKYLTINVAQYDNHPNPLYRVSAPWPALWESEHILQGEFFDQQKNNWISLNTTYDWGDLDEYNYQYSYLPNGYPSSVIIRFRPDNLYWKGIYVY